MRSPRFASLISACENCGKQGIIGHGWIDKNMPAVPSRMRYWCSIECGERLQVTRVPRNTKWPTPFEISAVIDASVAGGDFLDKIGKTGAITDGGGFDMITLSQDDWFEFILTVVNSYEATMKANGFAMTRTEN